MAFYFVKAKPKLEMLPELAGALAHNELLAVDPFGPTMTKGLKGARLDDEGYASFVMECQCDTPLEAERAHTLDVFFDELITEPVDENQGWARIAMLPFLFNDIPSDDF
jgi:hypothetical protein